MQHYSTSTLSHSLPVTGYMTIQRKGQEYTTILPVHTWFTANGYGTAAWKPEETL